MFSTHSLRNILTWDAHSNSSSVKDSIWPSFKAYASMIDDNRSPSPKGRNEGGGGKDPSGIGFNSEPAVEAINKL